MSENSCLFLFGSFRQRLDVNVYKTRTVVNLFHEKSDWLVHQIIVARWTGKLVDLVAEKKELEFRMNYG